MKFGIQLYTVREHTDDTQFKETISRLADMGFQGIEFAWRFGGMEPDALADFLKSARLECCGLHTSLDALLDPADKNYAYALACGARFITTSLASSTAEFKELAPKLEKAGSVARGKGLRLTYHNHHQEFTSLVDGVRAQDYLIRHTAPGLVELELDIGWIKKGGEDSMAYWREHGNRAPQIHLRDYDPKTDKVTDIGKGFIDLSAVMAQARDFNTAWLIYEQDCYPVCAFDSCQACAELAGRCGLIQ